MNILYTVAAHELEEGDQILITRRLTHNETVEVPFIVSTKLVEGDNVFLTGESLGKEANDAVCLWADEIVSVWSV